jgi:hypothetical protein
MLLLFKIHKPTADFLGRERWYEKTVTEMEMDLVDIDSLDVGLLAGRHL